MKQLLSITASLLIIYSCFDKDERVLPYPGEITSISDSIQTNQSWFDLETGTVVSSNPSADWELAFESNPEGWRVLVNSGADWFIYNTGSEDFATTVGMPVQLEGLYDSQRFWPDSTATGNWTLHDNIYLLARYENGRFGKHKKVRFLSFNEDAYEFYYVDSVAADTVTILKDGESNFSYYSFENNSQVYPEPGKTDYDLVFTSYYDLATLFGQTIPYKVGGVLLNTWNTNAAIDSIRSFAEIGTETISLLNFTGKRDVPGFNWKDVIVDITGGGTATYNVKTNYNYVVRTAQGNYYKLRFLSYTLDGRSGFPRFEYSLLQ